MFAFSFKNRIAFYYIISTAMLIFVVFVIIYFIVSFSVLSNVNENINFEINEYLEKIEFADDNVKLIDQKEWFQEEHNEVTVNPVFLELTDRYGKITQKSENLKNKELSFFKGIIQSKISDNKLSEQLIRQIQVPLFHKKKLKGYLLVAVSLEEATSTLNNLQTTFMIVYPIVLLLLFLVARIIAGRSIKPIKNIIETSSGITKDNLKSRILLPPNHDELYILSQTINDLLDRIENAIEREKQFTSDASHELRTPLAVLKGTLEVLVRKPRDIAEYEAKIHFCVTEVDRLNHLVDQLLILARFENKNQTIKIENVFLNKAILDSLVRFSDKIKFKNIKVKNNFDQDFIIVADHYLISIIINNVLSNAIKYSHNNGDISIKLTNNNNKIYCTIKDDGIGIPKEDIDKIFIPFYRSIISLNTEIKGSGLGLSIVKRLCSLLNTDINITSEETRGTIVILSFPQII